MALNVTHTDLGAGQQTFDVDFIALGEFK